MRGSPFAPDHRREALGGEDLLRPLGRFADQLRGDGLGGLRTRILRGERTPWFLCGALPPQQRHRPRQRELLAGERERDQLRIRSEAYRKSETIVGRADSLSTYIYAQAYDKSPDSREFYTFLKTMETYSTTLDASTMLILSTDGEFYKGLKSSRP